LFYAQGYAFQKQQKYPQTVQVITEGLTYISDNNTLEMQMLMLLGEAHHETKNYEKSGEAFEKALRIAPNNALLMNNYAYYIALENGNLVRAENFAQRANTLNPKNASFEDTYAYILFKKQAYAEAKVWIERAVQNSPTPDATILEHKGDILYKLGLENEAVDAWQMAQKLGTNNAVLIKKITTKQYHNE
jgi:tetratricopeptide (TPR) repeat protein